METKKCNKCGKEQPISEFDKHNSTKDKRQTWCRTCKNARRRERRRAKEGCYKDEYKNNRDKHLAICRRRNERYKQTIISHYSPDMKCCKCGFNDMRALSIDHINSDGAKHRKEIGSGNSLYCWLLRNNFPEGFQVLCMNCQFIKRHEECEYRKYDKEKIFHYKKKNAAGIEQINFTSKKQS